MQVLHNDAESTELKTVQFALESHFNGEEYRFERGILSLSLTAKERNHRVPSLMQEMLKIIFKNQLNTQNSEDPSYCAVLLRSIWSKWDFSKLASDLGVPENSEQVSWDRFFGEFLQEWRQVYQTIEQRIPSGIDRDKLIDTVDYLYLPLIEKFYQQPQFHAYFENLKNNTVYYYIDSAIMEWAQRLQSKNVQKNSLIALEPEPVEVKIKKSARI